MCKYCENQQLSRWEKPKLAVGPCARERWMGAGSAPDWRGSLVVVSGCLSGRSAGLQWLKGWVDNWLDAALSSGQYDGPSGGSSCRFGVTFSHLRLEDLISLPCNIAEWQESPERKQQLLIFFPSSSYLCFTPYFKRMLLSFFFFCKREKYPFAFPFFLSWCTEIVTVNRQTVNSLRLNLEF